MLIGDHFKLIRGKLFYVIYIMGVFCYVGLDASDPLCKLNGLLLHREITVLSAIY